MLYGTSRPSLTGPYRAGTSSRPRRVARVHDGALDPSICRMNPLPNANLKSQVDTEPEALLAWPTPRAHYLERLAFVFDLPNDRIMTVR